MRELPAPVRELQVPVQELLDLTDSLQTQSGRS